jgi:regulation of enolase protein 1 (concanavalin A-like superfamily)
MLRTLALAVVVALTLPLTTRLHAADSAWEVVRSKLGDFTIELPTKPDVNESRVRKGVGGNVKTVLLGCKTEAGIYIVYKVILPTAIVKGSEDDELDAERDSLVKEWKGKLMSERRIRAGEKVGRDFTVRGKPEKDEGVLTIRVREYLSDKSVYLMAVVSRPNRELPDDSGRFLGSLIIGTKRAEGSPALEPKGVAMAPWGEAVDPDKDCEITEVMKKLQLKVPGTRHDLVGGSTTMNAPRVMREVEGDFTITVKVVGDFRPGGKSTNPKGVPFNGAGILVWRDADNFIRLERAAVARGKKLGTYVNFGEFEGGAPGTSHNEVMKGGDCWVRMERKGSRIHGSISFDGTAWKELKPIQTVWPTTLKVGVTAVSSSSLPFTVTFEDFDFKGKAK